MGAEEAITCMDDTNMVSVQALLSEQIQIRAMW